MKPPNIKNRDKLLVFAVLCFVLLAIFVTTDNGLHKSSSHHDDGFIDHTHDGKSGEQEGRDNKPPSLVSSHFHHEDEVGNEDGKQDSLSSSSRTTKSRKNIDVAGGIITTEVTPIRVPVQKREKTSREHLLLPDFQLPTDLRPDSDFVKLYQHFHHDQNQNQKQQQQQQQHEEESQRTTFYFPKPIVAEYVRQLHHGIYQIKAKVVPPESNKNNNENDPHHGAGDGGAHNDDDHDGSSSIHQVTFAFKTECRPASKWHGQQGYTEVFVNWVVKKLFGADKIRQEQHKDENHDNNDNNNEKKNDRRSGLSSSASSSSSLVQYPIGTFAPGAVGGIVEIPERFQKEIHRDGCGYVTAEQLSQMYPASTSNWLPSSPTSKIMVGVVLQWKPQHKDDAIPTSGFLQPWRLVRTDFDSKKSQKKKSDDNNINNRKSNRHKSDKAFIIQDLHHHKSAIISPVLQMSDIFVLDYIVGNEDRLEKNWFKDEHGRFIAMDNGWALAGMNYQGSVCDVDAENLKCPPLFRGLAKSECRNEMIVNCRFRNSTVNSLRRFSESLILEREDETKNKRKTRSMMMKIVQTDPLIRYLSRFYGGEIVKKTKNKNKGGGGKKATRLWNEALARYVDSCEYDNDDGTKFSQNVMRDHHEQVVDELIRQGLRARTRKLLEHIDQNCIERFGEDQVLL